MNEKTKQWITDIVASPEYRAAGIAQDLILLCEKRRVELGLTYTEVARRMGVSRQRVATLMSGTQNATIGSLVRLATVLECNLEFGLTVAKKKQAQKKTKPPANKNAKATKPKRRQPKKPAPTQIRI